VEFNCRSKSLLTGEIVYDILPLLVLTRSGKLARAPVRVLLYPSSACRHLLPQREKGAFAACRFNLRHWRGCKALQHSSLRKASAARSALPLTLALSP